MKTIVALGGEDVKNPQASAIEEFIVTQTGAPRPKGLLIPTALQEQDWYINAHLKIFAKDLGCQMSILRLITETPAPDEIKHKIAEADFIFTGGGHTRMMIDVWKKCGVDQLLKEAWEQGTVMSGVSAGAICWFTYGSTDSPTYEALDPTEKLVRMSALGFVPGLFSPHHTTEPQRRDAIIKIMKNTDTVGFAVDDKAALVIQDDKYTVIRSDKNAKVHRVFYSGEELVYENITTDDMKVYNELFIKE
ncbi:MAG: Type 1 glutamine amidotransferase-like domain-containing protein [Candidatus Dojkabacteria bacterium]